ncbi:uncharacterized protein DUF2563 [Streptomyces sp. Ag109_G2-6]|uniref:DUF2563 family protein n=1 Tax=Streptomyces TaxID=1883 RepID=UPI000FC17F71|nr:MULTISPECIES: DUF2563 family protein [Streptomyces]RPF40849.1 uncharacterized protein DUF2563 [Streptomyces sp. Ag109_G2-6]
MAGETTPGLLGGGNIAGGVADAVMRQAKALEVEYESLTDAKKRVDALLKKLDGSEADAGKLAHGSLPAGTLGTGFAEAESLFKAYDTVHSELQKLSQGLAGQIEALGIAIQTAGKGYAGVDEDTQARMRALIRRSKEEYVEDRDPLIQQQKEAQKQHQGSSAPATPTPTPSTSKGTI